MSVDVDTESFPEGTDGQERRFRRLLRRLFVENGLYGADDDPFAEQRARVNAPINRLFTTFGRRYWRSFSLGLGAGVAARLLDLLPPLVLAVAIDAVFLQTRPYALPLVPAAVIPPGRQAQFWLSVGLIGGAFALASVAN